MKMEQQKVKPVFTIMQRVYPPPPQPRIARPWLCLGKPQKFFGGSTNKTLNPPSSLIATFFSGNFFFELQKFYTTLLHVFCLLRRVVNKFDVKSSKGSPPPPS